MIKRIFFLGTICFVLALPMFAQTHSNPIVKYRGFNPVQAVPTSQPNSWDEQYTAKENKVERFYTDTSDYAVRR
jgi:hypothetical protein